MQGIETSPYRRGGGSAHPVTLLALALGVAIGACLASGPVRSAEAETGGMPQAGTLAENFGIPKRVQTVRVPAETGTPSVVSKQVPVATWSYQGDTEYRRCIDQSDGTNLAWGECGGALIAREDARLNAAWKRVYAAGEDTKAKELLDEQRAWILFKEASCRFYANGAFGREGQVLSFPVCRARTIAQRTAVLDQYGNE